MKSVGKVLRCIVSIILIAIIVVNFTLIVKTEVNKDKIPDFLGYTPFIIVSGSMEPTIMTNDVILTNKIKQQDIQVGDVLTYKSSDGIVVTHRVIRVEEQDGEKVYIFKGDNNYSEDQEKISYSNIQGKYLFSIPFIGTLVTYVKTPSGMAMVIGGIVLVFAILEIIGRMFENKDLEKIEKKIGSNKK